MLSWMKSPVLAASNMKILISNDDGWGSKGILTLVRAMRQFGEVVVVAPDGPRSGMSSAISVLKPVRLTLVQQEPGLTVYTCTGNPADCIKMGLQVACADGRPDLVCSGINHGDNGTVNVLYSGTMGAVFVGCEQGIRSIGWSIDDHSPDADFSFFEPYIIELTKRILLTPNEDCLCWNINAPVGPIRGMKITRQERGFWTKEWQPYTDPTGKTFYMLTGEFVPTEKKLQLEEFAPEEIPTDHAAMRAGYIAVTPTTIDMTDYSHAQILPL